MAANVVANFLTDGNLQAGLLFVLVLFLYWRVSSSEKKLNLPPGPKGWPLVGNLLSLGFHSERDMTEFNRKYGPVCRLKMGKQNFVILGSIEAVNEAFVNKNEIFFDRMQNSLNILPGDGGIIFVEYGKFIKEQKRFCISALKDFGMGRRSIEPGILELCSDLNEDIDCKCENNEAFTLDKMLYSVVSGVISKLVFGRNLLNERKEFRDYIHMMVHGAKNKVLNTFIMFCPNLKAIPPFRSVAQELRTYESNFIRFMQDEIDYHMANKDSNQPRDLIDCFLSEMDKAREYGKETGFNEKQLKMVVRDIILAGTDSTSSTLRWILLYLCKNLNVQDRLHEEIDEVLGHSKSPSMSFLDQMPYTRAVIQETMRLRPIAPLGVPHLSKEAGTIMGYEIPKGTAIAANLFGIHHDEKMWPNPDKFDPTRHLDSDGKFEKSPNIIPFSIGARQCIGILLANMEFFLFLVSMLQKFSFTLADGQNIDMRGYNAFALKLYPYKVIASRR